MNEEYTVGYNDGYQTGRNEAIDELEQENRLLRARNDRLEKEISELQESNCKYPLCQNEQYQQDLAEQIKRELYTGQPAQRKPLTDDEIWDIYVRSPVYVSESFLSHLYAFARAIEAAHNIKENT